MIRNPKYNQNETIDCEINHPRHGWIPFTASPEDSERHGRVIYDEIVSGKRGDIAPADPPAHKKMDQADKKAEEKDRLIKRAYIDEALPLMLEAQAGMRDMKDFQAKMEEIQIRYSDDIDELEK